MLQLNDIKVRFSYKQVLDGVNAVFQKGKIYSLLGENGAGKSTLAHIICGDIKPAEGNIHIDGKTVSFNSPEDAIKNHILCVHQKPLLSKDISILENLTIGNKNFDINKAFFLAEIFIPGINLKTKVCLLSLAEQFFVSLIGILLKNPDYLILDEPTALLNKDQQKILFDFIKELSQKGTCILIITHFIEDALFLSDYIILLKDGKKVCETPGNEISKKEITHILYNKDDFYDFTLTKAYTDFLNNKNVELIHAENKNAFFEIENRLCRRHISDKSKTGIIFSDRVYKSSNPKLSVFQVITAMQTKKTKKELEVYAKNILQKADVNIKLNEKASSLSGGMLQRIILQREISLNPEKLILCTPFQGLDFAASSLFFDTLLLQLKKGVKIVIVEA